MNFNQAFERFGLSTEYHAIIKDLNEIKTLYEFLMVAKRIIAFADKINLETSRLIGRNEAIIARNDISIKYREKAMAIDQTIIPNIQVAKEKSFWFGAAAQAEASEEFMAETSSDNTAMHKVYEALDSLYGALDKIEKNKRKLVPFKDDPAWIAAAKEPIHELGQQQKGYGSKGYFRTDDPLPSFPSRAPLHPTANPLTGSNAETEACWCAWCEKDVPVKHDMAAGKIKCEDHAHLCQDKQWRMLTTRIWQGSDTRPNTADLSKRKERPGSGVVEMICYLCPVCNKKSLIQAEVDLRNEKKCPHCFAKLSDKDVVTTP